MKYLFMPFVYVLTLGLAPLFLYWYTNLYVYCLFDQMTQAKFDSKIQKVLEKKKVIDQIMAKQRERQQIIEGDDQLGYLSVKVTSTPPDVNMDKEKEMLLNSVTHILIEDEKGEPEVTELHIVETSKY